VDQNRRTIIVDVLANAIVVFLSQANVDKTKTVGLDHRESLQNSSHDRLSSSATDRSL
jgi:hypothetical protein